MPSSHPALAAKSTATIWECWRCILHCSSGRRSAATATATTAALLLLLEPRAVLVAGPWIEHTEACSPTAMNFGLVGFGVDLDVADLRIASCLSAA